MARILLALRRGKEGSVIAPKARTSRMKGGDYRMFFSILSALCNILSFFIRVAEFILHIKDKRKK